MPNVTSSSTAALRILDFWPVTSGATIASVTTQSATVYEVVLSNGAAIRYTGSGFAYAGTPALPTGGTYTTIERFDAGHTLIGQMDGAVGDLSLILTGDPSLAALAGNDTITGGSGNDVLLGRAGNDVIFDTAGAVTNIDAGVGDDAIIIGANTFVSGTIKGAAGTDTLFAEGDIHALTLSGLEVLQTGFGAIVATAAQLEVFDTIRFDSAHLLDRPTLNLFATGAATVLDLADELNSAGPRGVNLNGSSDAEALTTGAGSDSIVAGGGDDSITSGAGADTLIGDAGNDTLRGGADADRLEGGAGSDSLDGGDGSDVIIDATTDVPGPGTTFIDGGLGDDALIIGAATFNAGSIFGGDGRDTLFAEGDIHTLTLDGLEVLQTGFGAVVATAAQLEVFDTIRFDSAHLLDRPTLNLFATGAATVLDLADELNSAGPRGVNLNGSSDAENITTGDGADSIFAGDGNDTVDGGRNNDTLNGEGGVNTASYASATGNVQIDLFFGTANGSNDSDTLANFQNAIGGAGNDNLNGTSGANLLEGGAGNDTLAGDRQNDNAGGNDTLVGGDGDDVIIDMYGDVARVSGGLGSDRVTIGFGPGLQAPSSGVLDGGEDIGGQEDDVLILNVDSNLANFAVSGFESLFAGSSTVTGRAADFTAFSRIAFNDVFPNNPIKLVLQATGEITSVDLAAALTAGGAPKATIFGSTDDEAISSGSGNDSLSGGDGADTLSGGAGNDALVGNAGLDTYRFGAFGFGNDTITGFISTTVVPESHEIIDLGGLGLTFADLSFAVAGGVTTISIAGHAGDTIALLGVTGGLTVDDFSFLGAGSRDFIGNAAGNVADAEGAVLTGFTGGTLADLKDAFGDHFFANGGADSVQAGAGDDTIEGGAGNDTLRGGDGNDTVAGGLGADLLDGGAGVNTLRYAGATVGVVANLLVGTAGGGAGADTLTGFANVIGSGFDDTLVGNALANMLLGGAGNDVMSGGTGDDTLRGEAGDDRLSDLNAGVADIEGGVGNDVIVIGNGLTGRVLGGDGNDALEVAGATVSLGGLTLSRLEELRSNAGTVLGTAAQFEGFSLIRQDDSAINDGLRVTLNLIASGADVFLDLSDELNAGSTVRGAALTGTDDAETLTTGAGADLVLAGAGNDVVSGGSGNDVLQGGLGDDRLLGGLNDDVLRGEEGADTLLGGDGNDRLIEMATDAISVGGGLGDDVLQLEGAGSLTGSYAGGGGSDTLQLTGTSVLTALTLSSVEVLETADGTVTALASQLASLTTLWRNGTAPDGSVSVVLAASGSAKTLNLSSALQAGGTRAIDLTGSADDETLTTGGGNDSLSGGAGSDTLTAGAGDDQIIDTVGTSVSIDGGLGDDEIVIGSVPLGAVNGGDGVDTLRAGGNISALVLSNLEILQTGGNTVTGTAVQFDGFDTIRTAGFDENRTVSLALRTTGGPNVLDLSDELTSGGGPRAVQLFGTGNDDTLTTGAGADTVSAGLGFNVVTTGEGNDSIQSIGQDRIRAEGGDDTIDIRLGRVAALTLNGGTGTDTLITGTQNLAGTGLQSIEILHTQGGVVTGTAAQFEQFDTIRFGDSSAAEMTQFVTLTLVRPDGLNGFVDLENELNSGGGPRGVLLTATTDTEDIRTGDGNDTINGNGGTDTIRAGLGDDTILLRAGREAHVFGDGGNDLFTIGAGALGSPGASGEVVGGFGDDTLVADGRSILRLSSTAGVETLFTGLGGTHGSAANFEAFDVIARSASDLTGTVELRLNRSPAAYVLDLVDELSRGGLRGVLVKANELAGMSDATISTGNGKDRIEAGDGADVISTAGGNDTIIDLAGASTGISAGKGNDLINLAGSTFGGGTVDGGLGSNTLIASGADLSALALFNLQVLEAGAGLRALASQLEGFERIVAGTFAPDATVRMTLVAAGAHRMLDLSSELSLGGSRSAQLFGSSDAESLVLGSGNDSVNGGAGSDSIAGNSGADVLLGRAGKDTLLGGGGDDILCGGASADRMTGGAGADRFVFVEHKLADADVITDFTSGLDKVVVARADFGNFDTQGGLQVLPSAWFRAIAGGNATDASDRFVYDTATGRLFFDVDGAGGFAKTLIATLNGNPLLGSADFDVQNTISFGF